MADRCPHATAAVPGGCCEPPCRPPGMAQRCRVCSKLLLPGLLQARGYPPPRSRPPSPLTALLALTHPPLLHRKGAPWIATGTARITLTPPR